MKPTTVSLEQWKALYQAAKEFGEIKPWKWMKETDIFGVQNSLTGEIGYCCIMGELDEVLAMAVYSGTEGLQGYIDIAEGLVEPDDPDLMFSQDCLMVSFEDKEDIETEDKALIRKLGLKFSGGRSWPLFSRYEPGFLPSPISGQDVRYLTVVLKQAKDLCLRLQKDDGLLRSSAEGAYLIRVPVSGKEVWEDTWMVPAPLKKTEFHALADEVRIQKIRKIAKPSPATWEVDFFYAPTPIEAARPYYPYAVMIADSGSGFIHDMQLSDKTHYRTAFPDYILACIENTAMVPTEILVRREEISELLQPLTIKLGIRLSTVRGLPAIDNARRSMTEELQGRGPLSDAYCGDDMMEEYLEEAGSELSIFGLYGLLYACHAAPQPVMPTELLPHIFGTEGPCLETEEETQAMIGNLLSLWNLIGQWDPENEDIMLPEFQYDTDSEGALYRLHDALALASSFLVGLELGGITFAEVSKEMKQDADALLTTTELLYTYAELFNKEKKFTPRKLEEALKAIANAEFIIAESIANLSMGLKSARQGRADQFTAGPKSGQKGVSTAGAKTGRNDPCPCGSGRKYKKCCGIVH